ncbi:MAG: ribosome biogenesis GTP-binding protein YsxC [Acidobacteria bacterium]|nr:ribosome biogenesis GTP-binding protein YsxC [Acidobacteriota bacterium]
MPRRVTSARFVISAAGPRDFPTDGLPEIAMVGRSNVGKSTLINALVGQPVARTSAAPGKTRLVNVYRVEPAAGRPLYLVDLPGYGHAGGGEKARREFAALTGQYFASRIAAPAQGGRPPSLAGIILAIDARHPGLDSDADAVRWAGKLGLPFLLVATKVDKLKQAERARLARGCEAAFGLPPLATSTQTGEGLDELWRVVREWTFLIPEP